MAIPQIATINTKDEVLNRIQAELQKVNTALVNPLLNGTLVLASLKAAGAVAVNHGLGRAPQGWILVAPEAQASVWGVPAEQKNPKQQLVLRTSADVVCQLWVF